jgi:hypothetical protein
MDVAPRHQHFGQRLNAGRLSTKIERLVTPGQVARLDLKHRRSHLASFYLP